jgi:membrane protein
MKPKLLLRWFQRQWSRRRMPGLAAEAAFWLFFSLIPLAAVAGMLAAKIAQTRVEVWLPLLSGAPAAARELLGSELGRVSAWNSGTVGPVAALTFVWLASSGLHALFDALQANLGRTRPWIRTRLAALVACVLLSVTMAALVACGLLVGRWHLAERWGPGWTWAGRVVGLLWSFVFARGLFRLGLSPALRHRLPLTAGACLTALLQTLVGWAYVKSISLLGDGSAYLAGLASIGVTLTALFLYTLSLLVGLSFSQLLKRTARCRRLEALRQLHIGAHPAQALQTAPCMPTLSAVSPRGAKEP